ncbi:unnamed protein product, partial [Lymnaea stagnalis]
VQYIVSLACLVISILCLVMTVFTYFQFSALRSTAGTNNTCLSASLLLAQGLLLACSHVSGPSTLCTFLAVANHFMWLWMFTWTFICSLHMFRVFSAKTRSTKATSDTLNLVLLKRVLASASFPMTIVCTVITSSYVLSDSTNIGYGGDVCQLNSQLLIGTSLVIGNMDLEMT